MLESYAVGPLAVVLVTVTWVGVQSAWKKVFARIDCDPDALAGRTGCHGCGGAERDACRRRRQEEIS